MPGSGWVGIKGQDLLNMIPIFMLPQASPRTYMMFCVFGVCVWMHGWSCALRADLLACSSLSVPTLCPWCPGKQCEWTEDVQRGVGTGWECSLLGGLLGSFLLKDKGSLCTFTLPLCPSPQAGLDPTPILTSQAAWKAASHPVICAMYWDPRCNGDGVVASRIRALAADPSFAPSPRTQACFA